MHSESAVKDMLTYMGSIMMSGWELSGGEAVHGGEIIFIAWSHPAEPVIQMFCLYSAADVECVGSRGG